MKLTSIFFTANACFLEVYLKDNHLFVYDTAHSLFILCDVKIILMQERQRVESGKQREEPYGFSLILFGKIVLDMFRFRDG